MKPLLAFVLISTLHAAERVIDAEGETDNDVLGHG